MVVAQVVENVAEKVEPKGGEMGNQSAGLDIYAFDFSNHPPNPDYRISKNQTRHALKTAHHSFERP